jgi:hypothetical protein
MTGLRTISRVTVYSDRFLESQLLEQVLKLGAKGYTVVDCRGKGQHEVVEDPMSGISRVRIETLVQPDVGEKIMEYLSRDEFKRRSVTACIETVGVTAAENL